MTAPGDGSTPHHGRFLNPSGVDPDLYQRMLDQFKEAGAGMPYQRVQSPFECGVDHCTAGWLFETYVPASPPLRWWHFRRRWAMRTPIPWTPRGYRFLALCRLAAVIVVIAMIIIGMTMLAWEFYPWPVPQ